MAEFEQKIQHSEYLLSLRHKYPSLRVDGVSPLQELERICTQLEEQDRSQSAECLEHYLLECKAEFAWYWAAAELQSKGTFAQRGAWQTRFAELSIDLALSVAWGLVGQKNPQIARVLAQQTPALRGQLPGFFLLGLGKLGGGDLNFSSDTDLIAYFDPDIIPIPPALGASYICHQVAQQLTKILGQGGGSGFIWRLDWRLRPNASATTLAMSTAAAQDYYFYRASPWHRLALMKARVIAGDIEVGGQFMQSIVPFVWRQNLDYRALDELGEIKNKIKREHPSLRAERAWREPVNDNIAGFNVKLGTGGIREIEFVANALQLVWGGKHSTLRTPNTLEALLELERLERLPTGAAQELAASYQYLRRLENALQIMANQQTHIVPQSETLQQALLGLLGIDSWGNLVAELNQHRETANYHFSQLFAEHAKSMGPEILWPDSLTESARDVVDIWERGFVDYGVTRDLRARLQPLQAGLAEALSNASDASTTAIRLHDFFRSLPQGEQYFRLLAESPSLLDAIIQPLLHSPVMSLLLKQSPHIVDSFLHADCLQVSDITAGNFEFESDYVRAAHSYEAQLERMRRFVNEQLYQLYLAFLQGHLEPRLMQRALTELARHTLALGLQVVADNMGLEEVPISVIGMGKMGVNRMAPQSDLDLIFVFDPERCSLDIATKFVARLQTGLATPMREGVVYELDTRLRPSGRSGAATVSVDSFKKHQLGRARNWEHIALVSASVVTGTPHLSDQIMAVKREVLATQRDQTQLLRDAHKMWLRISEHRVLAAQPELIQSKLSMGGLMQAEYTAACAVLMQGGVGEELGFYDLLASTPLGLTLQNTIDFWQNLQIWERLLGLQSRPVSEIPPVYVSAMLEHLQCNSINHLIARQAELQNGVKQAMAELFSAIPEEWNADDWQERAVDWV